MDFAARNSFCFISYQILESLFTHGGSPVDPSKREPDLSSQSYLSEQYGDAMIIVLYIIMLMFKPSILFLQDIERHIGSNF